MSKKPEHLDENLEQIEEDSTAALASLKPDSMPVGPDPKSKVEHMTAVLDAMHAMKKDDLTSWFTKAMELIGKEASHLPASANEKSNEASVRMKPSHATGTAGPSANDIMPKLANITPGQAMREDVEEMFADQDLSEEFKEKASTLFEAAVNLRITTEMARLEEAYDARLQEEVEEITESLERKLDSYLDYVVETWMKENEVAIESSLRNEVTEEFIDGLRNLFTEHYIDIPESKVDVVESLAYKVEQLESRLDEVISENTELKGDLTFVQRKEIFEELSEGLTMVQAEKFGTLAESIQFDGNLDVFKQKLAWIKDSYFAEQKRYDSNILSESFESDDSNASATVSPEVSRYVQAISRSVKK